MQKKKPRKVSKTYLAQVIYLDFLFADVAPQCHVQMKPFYWLVMKIAEHITKPTVIYNKSLVFFGFVSCSRKAVCKETRYWDFVWLTVVGNS